MKVADEVRRTWQIEGRWFGHLERKGVDDWVLVCSNVVVAGRDRVGWVGRLGEWTTYGDGMKLLGMCGGTS